MSNLHIRMITAFFLTLITLASSWAGGVVFTGFALLVGAALYYEWQTLTHAHQTTMLRVVGWCFYGVIGILLLSHGTAKIIWPAVFAASIILLLLSKRCSGWVVGGLVYATVAPVALVLIRRDDALGFEMLIFLYAVVWGTDSAAYFTGKAIGGAKLVPHLSPNKTWSGAIGGVIAGIILGVAALSCLFNANFITVLLGVPILLILGLILSIASQLGDMGESWMKRHFHVKDSSNLLPGHGGFMDRLDGLITASIVFYVIAAAFGGMDEPALFFQFILK